MIDRTLAKRYARALLDVAAKRDCVREVETQILAAADAYAKNKGLQDVLGHPSVSKANKIKIVRAIFETRVRIELMEFLVVLLDNRRFDVLPEIAIVYDSLADEYEGLVRIEVTSFLTLSPEEKKRLMETLSRLVGGRQVALTEREDKALLGGMSVRIGDILVDGSVAGRLKKLKESMAASARA